MRLLITLFEIVLTAYLFDKSCVWLERRGWLFYRHHKPRGGATGCALQELNALLSQNGRQVIEMKQNEVRFKKNDTEAPNEPID